MNNLYVGIKRIMLVFCTFWLFIFWLILGMSGSVNAEILYEFTNCGQTGPSGPSQSQCDTAYLGTTLEGQMTVNNGIQLWIVPQSGTYTIETWGAEGGYTNAGRGAYMKGDFYLDAGTVLRVLVGQKGQAGPAYYAESGGGGGGTFVVDASNVPLIIAGGGGGCYYDYTLNGQPCAGGGGPGRIEESGGPDGAGGQNGNGGYSTGQYAYGGGGGGFYTDGEAPNASSSPSDYARSFLNGGTGGDCRNLGSFGGGGCTTNNGGNVGAGGGGYSGGNSGEWTQSGGGGSFNSGSNQNNIAGSNAGHGRVIISMIVTVVDSDSDGWSLPADCNDNDNTIFPGAAEAPNDGIDQDCNGFDLAVEALINAAANNQQSQTVAWNSVDKEYLVLWQDFRNGAANPDIYGARLDKNGNAVAGNLPVITQTAKQAGPWVSYGGGGYISVWIDQRNISTTGTDVYGAWILPDGTVSSEFVVTNASANQRAASVVYNPTANNFLVTWTDDTNGANDGDVWGAVINPGGGVSGSPFAMVTAIGNQRGPYVRYDYGNNRYFMVWFDNRNGANDVYGSRVSASGTLLDGSGIVISNANGNQNNPRITDRRPADGISNFILSWIDLRNGQADIYGAVIDEFGTKMGSDIQIAGGSYDQRASSIDVDYIRTGQAVVSWIDNRNGTDFDIYRAQVDQSGVVSGEALVSGAATGAANNQQGPLVTYSEDAGSDNGFLFSWRDDRSGVDYDIYGIKVWP